MFDLKTFREQKLHLSQAQLAARLGVSQDYISRIEKGAQEPTIDFLRRLCDAFAVTPEQVLNYSPARPQPLDAGEPYVDTERRRATLEKYIQESRLESHIQETERTDPKLSPELLRAKEALSRGREIVDRLGCKPVGVVLGPSDAGKSRLLNTLTGLDKLVADWTPTTSITVYLKHLDDRPEWFKEEAWVFKEAADGLPQWDFRRFREKDYCESWKLIGGGVEVLREYGTRQGGRSGAAAALVFIDSPILRSCDLVDLPGFGTGSVEDDIQAQQAREVGDFIIYLCPAAQFMHARDIQFMRDVIRHLPPLERLNPRVPTMGNLFVIASMAHVIKPQDDLPGILDKGADRLYKQIHEETWSRRAEQTGRSHGDSDLRKRFFTYTLEDAFLRKDFEDSLKVLLQNWLPEARRDSLDQAVSQYRTETLSWYEERISEQHAALQEQEQLKKEYEERQRQIPSMRAKLDTTQRSVRDLIQRLRDEDKQKLRLWYAAKITPAEIEKMINRKEYDKKDAQELLAGNVSDEIHQELQRTLSSSSETFRLCLEQYLDQFQAYASDVTKVSINGTSPAVDMQGLIIGSLVGAGALGALGVIAGSLGNLGGYILVAKGVSLLSALGISVGGTAAAASFVATIGGPITLGIGIALGLGLLVKALFGERWQSRLAKRLYQQLQDKRVLDQYCQGIDRYWTDTEAGFKAMVDRMHGEIERRMEERGRLLTSQTPDEIEAGLRLAERLRDFFAGVPWGPIWN